MLASSRVFVCILAFVTSPNHLAFMILSLGHPQIGTSTIYLSVQYPQQVWVIQTLPISMKGLAVDLGDDL